MGDSEESIAKRIDEFKTFIDANVKSVDRLKYFGAIGDYVYRIGELKDSFHTANIVFANRFIGPYNQILTTNVLHQDEDKISIGVKGINTIEENRTLLLKFLKNGTREDVVVY